MKNILNYYYNIIVDEIDNEYFSYDNHLFCLYEYKRNINEIDSLFSLNNLMLSRNIMINKIIKNIFDSIITNHDNKNYILIMINYEYRDNLNNKFILSFPNKELDILKRNDWGRLWSIKIDYIEYQLHHIKNKYQLINNSINYYIGLAENAISYFNMLDLCNIPLYISHRRITKNNMYNPLELVIDYKVRDISEYIKNSFFNNEMTIYEIIEYINKINLDNIDYILLYVRLLYPSYYFDLYEKIINDNEDELEIERIIRLSTMYEKLLFEIYSLFKRKVNILGIDWINNKYL